MWIIHVECVSANQPSGLDTGFTVVHLLSFSSYRRERSPPLDLWLVLGVCVTLTISVYRDQRGCYEFCVCVHSISVALGNMKYNLISMSRFVLCIISLSLTHSLTRSHTVVIGVFKWGGWLIDWLINWSFFRTVDPHDCDVSVWQLCAKGHMSPSDGQNWPHTVSWTHTHTHTRSVSELFRLLYYFNYLSVCLLCLKWGVC